MARPCSMDLRDRAIGAVAVEGLSRRAAAARFGVGVSTVITWVRRCRDTGSARPGRMDGHKPRKISGDHRTWHAVIVDVEATTAVRQAGVTAQRRMIDRTRERFRLWPERLAGNTGYGSAENLAWLVHERQIEPHIPVFDKSQRTDGTFSRDDFTYDHERD